MFEGRDDRVVKREAFDGGVMLTVGLGDLYGGCPGCSWGLNAGMGRNNILHCSIHFQVLRFRHNKSKVAVGATSQFGRDGECVGVYLAAELLDGDRIRTSRDGHEHGVCESQCARRGSVQRHA